MEIERLSEVSRQLGEVSPSLCLAKWYQTTLHLFNGNTQSCHHVLPHRVPLKELEASPAALHNTEFKKRMRASMLAGGKPKECEYCWNIERVGEFSDRAHKSGESWALPYLSEAVEAPPTTDVMPTYLEVAFDNICNFKCAYCSPAYSSSWEAEIRKHGAYPTSTLYNALWRLDLRGNLRLPDQERERYARAFWEWWPQLSQSLHHLRVTGGEPLLSAGTWRLLDSLIEQPKPGLILSVNSNLGVPAKLIDDLLARLAKLEGRVAKVTLFCSIDTVGAAAEYIRYGLKYDEFTANVRRILEESAIPIRLAYMVTVNALSLPGLPRLLETVAAQRQEFQRHEIGLDTPYLNHPEHLSVRLLTPEFQEYVAEAIRFMRSGPFSSEEIQRLERVLELMRAEPFPAWKRWLRRQDLVRFLDEYDRRRGTDHRATFPEYASFFAKCRAPFSSRSPLASQ